MWYFTRNKAKLRQTREKQRKFSVYVVNPHAIPHIYLVIQDYKTTAFFPEVSSCLPEAYFL